MTPFGTPNVKKLAAKRDVKRLVKALSNPSVRDQADYALATLHDARAVEPLIGALQDKDASVRRAAAHALRFLADARAVEPLIGALHDTDASVREAAAEACRDIALALGKGGDPRAVPALLELAADDSDRIRVPAAYALAQLGDARAVPILLSALDHPYDMYSFHAVRGVGLLRPAEAVMPLVRILGTLEVVDWNSGCNWLAVVEALQAIGDPRAVDALLNWSQTSDSRGQLYASGQMERVEREFEEATVNALAVCGRQAVPTLVSSMRENDNRCAALALARLGWTPESDEERLDYAFARGELVEAGELGAIAVEPLLRALGCEPVDGRWIKPSGDFGNGDVNYQDTNRIEAIVVALGATGDARAVEPLMQLLSAELRGLWPSARSSVRGTAAGALGRIGRAMLDDENESVRTDGADLIAKLAQREQH